MQELFASLTLRAAMHALLRCATFLQGHQILPVAELDDLGGISINQPRTGNYLGGSLPIKRSL